MEACAGQNEEVTDSYGRPISIHELDKTYGFWVHTRRDVHIQKTPPDGPLALHKLRSPEVYEISLHVRGKAVLFANGNYHNLGVLKSAFEQLQFRVIVHVNQIAEEVIQFLRNECQKHDIKTANAFICLLYGTPIDFDACKLLDVLNRENCPNLEGKPKLLYIIGNDTVLQQVDTIRTQNLGPDYFVGATGFFGIMFFTYVIHLFAHELDAASLWKLEEQFSILHNCNHRAYSTLQKEFYFFPGLLTSDMPEEIEKMDPYEMELYLKMVEKSEMKTHNIRLMFVGMFGAGKTSLARRIMNLGIDGVRSTDGIDVYIGRCLVNLRNRQWTTTEDSSHKPYAKLSRLLNENPEEEAKLPNLQDLASDQPSKKMKFMEDIFPSTKIQENLSNNKQKKEACLEEKWFSSSDKCGDMDHDYFDQSPLETENTESNTEVLHTHSGASLSTAVKVLTESKTSKRNIDPEAMVSLWDFAGQFIYYATHQLFFSPRSIYLLVLNMTQDMSRTMNEKWFLDVDGMKDRDFKAGVLFWVKSIYTYSRSLIPGIPPIILVGTHKDRMEGILSDKRKCADKYFGEIFNAFVDHKIVHHLQRETFLVDNTVEDAEIDRLRDYILTTASSLNYWGESIPARWVEMEQMLEEIRTEGKPFITRTELEHLDNKLSIPIGDTEQLTLFLKYENATGILIYFDEDYLRNTIIIEPSWIINAFRFLISATFFDDKYGHLKKEWHTFIKTGKLKIELAEKIWKLDEKNAFFENSSLLFQFLDKLDIISRAKIASGDDLNLEPLDFYFVPCLLNEPPPEDLLLPPAGQGILSSSSLYFTFGNEFLPPAVFSRILSTCLGMWPAARQGNKQFLFCGCGVFELTYDKDSDIQRLVIFLKESKIGLRVITYGAEDTASIDSRLCDKIRRIISSALEKELNRYQLDNENSSHKAKPYLYAIQCPKIQKGIEPFDGLIEVDDLMQSYKNESLYFCKEHIENMHPHPLDPVDLLQDWFPDKVVVKGSSFLGRYSSQRLKECVTDKELATLSRAVGAGWQLLGITLGLTQAEVDQCQEARSKPVMQIYEMFFAWKQKEQCEATIGNLLKAMDECKTIVTLDQETIQNVLDSIL